MSGFMFDFSAPSAAEDNATNNDFMQLPEGQSECAFTFYTPEEVVRMSQGIINNDLFLETVLPFTRGGVATAATPAPQQQQDSNSTNDTGSQKRNTISIFHRQAPKVDVLECVADSNTAANTATAPPVVTEGQAVDGRRDIVQGAYYGGLKVWSCAPDVAEVVIFGTTEEEKKISQNSDDSDDDAVPASAGAMPPPPALVDFYGNEVSAVLNKRRQKNNTNGGAPGSIAIAELGCGQSLPTLAVLERIYQQQQQTDTETEDKSSSNYLLFLHDYNKEVISEVSLPNVAYSMVKRQQQSQQQLSSSITVAAGHGDWVVVGPNSFAHPTLNPSGYVDVIVGADVTFDMEATEKFLMVAARVLRPPTASSDADGDDGGFAIIGTKDYYFGTNGGLEEMKEVIRSKRLPLKLTVLGRRGVGTMVRVLVTLRRI